MRNSLAAVFAISICYGGGLKICHGISEISNRGIYIGVYRGDLIWRVLNFIS